MRAPEFLEERLLVAAVPDVIANVIGVREREDDKVMSAAVAERARAGGLGFFVLGLAVNDRRRGFARVFAHALPNAHHVAAGGVHDLAAALLDLLLDRQFGAKCRHDHDVLRARDRSMSASLVFADEILDA